MKKNVLRRWLAVCLLLVCLLTTACGGQAEKENIDVPVPDDTVTAPEPSGQDEPPVASPPRYPAGWRIRRGW